MMEEDVKVSVEMDEIEVIEDSEPMEMKELELMGVKKSELTEIEELLEMENETDKWYKFVL